MQDKDISFIIQGKILSHVNTQIKEIKKYFPNGGVIVSTCNPCNFNIVGADQIIYSKDPGFCYYSDRVGEKPNNINRQIVSTLAGLKVCKTKYVFKIRSDFFLTGNDFLKFWNKFNKSDERYKVFDHKVLSCCYFARNPRLIDEHYTFHPSDLAFFGTKKDLIKLFDISLMPKSEELINIDNIRFNRYVPEQYIFINCLRKNNFKCDCRFYKDCNEFLIEETERYFASNFIFLTFDQFNLKPTKENFNMKLYPRCFKSCYTHIEWQKLYKKYVDYNLDIPEKDNERLKIEKYYNNCRKYRLISNICAFLFRDRNKRRYVREEILKFFLNK